MQHWQETRERLHRYFRSRISDPDLVEDLLQEVLLKAFAKKGQVRDDERLTAWINRIANHVLIDHYRQKGRLQPEAEFGEHLPDSESNPPETDRTREFSACLLPMIQGMPEPYREALLLTELGGLSQKELAERLGISYSGAKSRVQRGREKLRERLLDCCHIQTDRYGNILDYQPKSTNRHE
jgi:RNA polymerase sigma-70 factor (ECF subfamily)